MEAFVTSYGLPFEPFRERILSTRALVAGSSALALYLKQEEIDLSFTPNDMDIFVGTGESGTGESGKDDMVGFLLQHGYHIPLLSLPDRAFYATPYILDIVWLENDARENIQIIHIDSDALLEYISEHFDLSCCVTWWEAESNHFETMYPNYTCEKQMFISNPITYEEYCSDTLQNVFRIHKYFNRGFELHLVQSMPPFLTQKDCRYELFRTPRPFQGITAFDIWQHEDISCRDFLAASPFHILLKVKEQLYAFHRTNLYQFMSTHFNILPVMGQVFRTPHNQSICYEGMQNLQYGDYSVFELHAGATIRIESSQMEVSLFHIHCYSMADWIRQVATRVITTDMNSQLSPAYSHDGEDDDMPELMVMPELVQDEQVVYSNPVIQGVAEYISDDDTEEWVAAIEAEYAQSNM